VLVEPKLLVTTLGLPDGTTVDDEPLGGTAAAPERVRLRPPGGSERIVLLRASFDAGEAMNHLAVMESLTNRGFEHAPKLLAVIDEVAVEEWIDASNALAIVPPPGAIELGVRALAALHGLALREGLDWEKDRGDLFPEDEVPLHRLGFAAEERETARAALAEAREVLLASPFGFAHNNATAAHLLFSKDRAVIINFEQSGFGAQLLDVAAFLLTSGVEAAGRRVLASQYAAVRGMDVDATADLVDLVGILWGIEELLKLPRRQIQSMGDDGAMEALLTMAARIDRGLKAAAGGHPLAARIRTALWPS